MAIPLSIQADIIEAYKSDRSVRQISSKHGISHITVKAVLNKNGIITRSSVDSIRLASSQGRMKGRMNKSKDPKIILSRGFKDIRSTEQHWANIVKAKISKYGISTSVLLKMYAEERRP